MTVDFENCCVYARGKIRKYCFEVADTSVEVGNYKMSCSGIRDPYRILRLRRKRVEHEQHLKQHTRGDHHECRNWRKAATAHSEQSA